MARRQSKTFTEVELEFMHIIWNRGEVTTDDILDELRNTGRELSDGSVRKILSILVRKGHITRRPEGRGFRYSAQVKKTDARRSMIRDLINRAFGGSPALLVSSLLDSRDIAPGDLEAISKLIDDHRKEPMR